MEMLGFPDSMASPEALEALVLQDPRVTPAYRDEQEMLVIRDPREPQALPETLVLMVDVGTLEILV